MVAMLPVADDLYSLVAKLPPRQYVVGMDHPLAQPMHFLEDLAGGVVLETYLARRHGADGTVYVRRPNDAVDGLEIKPPDGRLHGTGEVGDRTGVVAGHGAAPGPPGRDVVQQLRLRRPRRLGEP